MTPHAVREARIPEDGRFAAWSRRSATRTTLHALREAGIRECGRLPRENP
jgi:hypothetical protein